MFPLLFLSISVCACVSIDKLPIDLLAFRFTNATKVANDWFSIVALSLLAARLSFWRTQKIKHLLPQRGLLPVSLSFCSLSHSQLTLTTKIIILVFAQMTQTNCAIGWAILAKSMLRTNTARALAWHLVIHFVLAECHWWDFSLSLSLFLSLSLVSVLLALSTHHAFFFWSVPSKKSKTLSLNDKTFVFVSPTAVDK